MCSGCWALGDTSSMQDPKRLAEEACEVAELLWAGDGQGEFMTAYVVEAVRQVLA